MHIQLNRSNLPLATATIAVPVALCAMAAIARVNAQPPAGGELAGQKYKNIRVLKDVPAARLLPIMHNWNDSLGVKCDFCHTIAADHTGFERDDKPTKRAARAMVLMVKDINKREKAIEGKGTCFLCHHGKPEPESQPNAAQGGERR